MEEEACTRGHDMHHPPAKAAANVGISGRKVAKMAEGRAKVWAHTHTHMARLGTPFVSCTHFDPEPLAG